ncbi:MAG: hypothetical protein LUD39_02485 [Opitutae bacterium]|nr:hypothetical protein [Opitutae bacterium]
MPQDTLFSATTPPPTTNPIPATNPNPTTNPKFHHQAKKRLSGVGVGEPYTYD